MSLEEKCNTQQDKKNLENNSDFLSTVAVGVYFAYATAMLTLGYCSNEQQKKMDLYNIPGVIRPNDDIMPTDGW